MRKLILSLLIAGSLGGLATQAFGATKTVSADDNVFRPTSTSVRSGDTVVWRFVGDNPHNVTVTSGPQRFRSSTRSSGSYRKKVSRKGTYRIVCTIHSGMRMTLRVR